MNPAVFYTRWIATSADSVPDASLGAKAARLRDLGRLGIPVPPWIAVTTEASKAVLVHVEEEIRKAVEAVPSGDGDAARQASEEIARLVRSAPWPRCLRDELEERLRVMRPGARFAIRSSAAGEDGARSSYAGQLESFLHVPLGGVERAIRACWASAWSDRAILYRQARGLPSADLAMAVLVQEMVESRVAGIAFTADPVTGLPSTRVVAGYGLGDGIVTDQVESDEFVRESPQGRWRATVRAKTMRSARRRNGEPGTEIVPVPAGIQTHPALTPEELEELARYMACVEAAEGRPQDIEWAIDERRVLWILQARPITTSAAQGPLGVWDDGNIGESYPGITLPLTYSYVRRVYERVFTRAFLEIGVPEHVLDRAARSLGQLVGTIGGRLYLNVTELYRLYALVPGLEAAVRRWEDAFGVRPADDESSEADEALTDLAPAFTSLREVIVGPIRTRFVLARRFLTRARDVRRLRRTMDALLAPFEKATRADSGFEDLLGRFEALQRRCLDAWALVLFNDLYATYFSDRLAGLCGEGNASANGDATVHESSAAGDLHHRLLRGESRMESVGPLRSIGELAREARARREISSLLRSARSDREVWREILGSRGGARFRAMALEHIRKHGHRVMDELKFEALSLHEAPWMIVPLVRQALDVGNASVSLGPDRERRSAQREYERRFRRNPLRVLYARWILREARCTITDRENLALVRTRAHAVLRRLFRAMGDALATRGALARPEDVFYLRIEELEAFAGGGLPEGKFQEIVALRRERYAEYERMEFPHRIVCRGSVYSGGTRPEGDTGRRQVDSHRHARDERGESRAVLGGIPCSAGRVVGTARVIRSAASAGDHVAGEILVAPVTDPGWMFLMVAAKGLIVERGSVLSHTAIIGRELGIPTIVGVEGATDRIRTGDQIRMDGMTGEIEILGNGTFAASRPVRVETRG